MASKQFSIILPTFSGVTTLPRSLESILTQDLSGIECELIVVIDGPNKELKSLVESFRPSFSGRGIKLRPIQFKKNKGRFEARVAGSEAAQFSQLLFLEDRVFLGADYFPKLKNMNQKLIMSNVLEVKSKSNPIADSLSAVRKLVYGARWGQDFEDYLITPDNFERSPKGLASLWVPRDDFLAACKIFAEGRKGTRDANDDTGVLSFLIEKAGPIYRTSQIKIYYQPRTGLTESIKHLYERGPKFVDYYKKPGTKFFPMLIGMYAAVLLLVAVVILRPVWIIGALILFFLMLVGLALRTAATLSEGFRIIIGLPLVILIFMSGIIKGTLQAINGR